MNELGRSSDHLQTEPQHGRQSQDLSDFVREEITRYKEPLAQFCSQSLPKYLDTAAPIMAAGALIMSHGKFGGLTKYINNAAETLAAGEEASAQGVAAEAALLNGRAGSFSERAFGGLGDLIRGRTVPSDISSDERFISMYSSPQDRFTFAVENEGANLDAAKAFINKYGQPANQYLAKVMNENDVTIVGELHTHAEPNLHRAAGAEAVAQLPRGAVLAIEQSEADKPIFDAFSKLKGNEVDLPASLPGVSDSSLKNFKSVNAHNPEQLDMLLAARQHGVIIEPIDIPITPGTDVRTLNNEYRERRIAQNLLRLKKEHPDKPVVAWFGMAHADKVSKIDDADAFARRVALSPEFRNGRKKLSTVFLAQQGMSGEGRLEQITSKLASPVGVPVRVGGTAGPLADIPHDLAEDGKIGNFDHAVIYPPASVQQRAQWYARAWKAVSRISPADDVVENKITPGSRAFIESRNALYGRRMSN